jgi:hypothetical protein
MGFIVHELVSAKIGNVKDIGHLGAWLTQPLAKPDPREHRYEYWRVIANALGSHYAQHQRAKGKK